MEDRIIKISIPSQKEIEDLKNLGIDIETELIRAFKDELRVRLSECGISTGVKHTFMD